MKTWEDKNCNCGEGNDAMKGVVQLYKEEENAPYQKLPITVKLPLCLGALVSRQHILTTKYCFGSDKRVTKPGFHYSEKVWEQKGSFCESYIKSKSTFIYLLFHLTIHNLHQN